MRVLVTGGAGFIGSNLVQALLTGRHEVAVIDDLSTGSPGNIDPRARFIKSDILSAESSDFIGGFAPELVVHLAAQASVSVSLREPERDRLVNAQGTAAVARAAREVGARLMISASSAAVYGEPAELPLSEGSPKSPMNPYGASKLEAESLISAELDGSGTDYASFRFANVYGPRQDAAGEGGVVALFMSAVQEGKPPVIFGDGTQTRDFIYVGDIVAAILAAAAASGPIAPRGPAFNISTGRRTSVNELVGAVRAASGYLGPVENAAERDGDIRHSVLDPSKAGDVLGWSANVDLQTGIGLTWRWWASRG